MNTANKRKDAMDDNNIPKRVKKECSYGEACYRRNPAHFREYSHSHLEAIIDGYDGDEYPIPSHLAMQRHSILEQIEVIVEKKLYECKKKEDSSSSTSNTNTNPQDDKQSKFYDTGTSKNLTDKQTHLKTSLDKQSPNIDRSSPSFKMEKNIDRKSPNNLKVLKDVDKGSSSSCERNSPNSKIESNREKSPLRKDNKIDKGSGKKDQSKGESSSTNIPPSVKPKGSEYRPIVQPTRRAEDYLKVVRPHGKMAAKHAASAPYHIFYTTISDCKETHNQPYSITFLEILDSSLGELKCSLQINFMVEISWLLAQYYFAGYSEKKLTILYEDDCGMDLKNISKKKPQVDAHFVTMANPFGKHHTKMMLLCYEDGSVRVVVSTANLYADDWENRTQGLWLSPKCPELPAEAMPHEGDSPTGFKRSLLKYLTNYSMPQLSTYVERVKRCDFSHINVFLVASVPGGHFDLEWGMSRAGALLRQHCCIPRAETRQWPLIAQASSLGSYGAQPKLWLTGDFLHNFTKIKDQSQMLTQPPDLKLIYPSLENVRQSHDGLLGGGCLPYAASAHAKQPWLNEYLYQWRATLTERNRAMPHIKSYTRVDKQATSAAFYLLTSANVSKAAWGQINKSNGALRISSYEAGVLFLPKFVINKDFFPLQGNNRLIIPYDLPPVKYEDGMSPWVSDYLR